MRKHINELFNDRHELSLKTIRLYWPLDIAHFYRHVLTQSDSVCEDMY